MFNSLVGIGLRHPHYSDFITSKPFVGWVEVHSENYLCCGGASFDYLLKIRKDYPVSLHGVAMSLGSADGLDAKHLKQLKELINIIEPCFVSDHLSWSSKNDYFLPELLPIPYNDESLEIFSNNISNAQDFLNREIMFENPSTTRTGAGILLDVNNIYISSFNNEWSATQYLNSVKPEHVKELHLAGHSENMIGQDRKLLLDSHDDIVHTEVWDLYKKALSIFGVVPTLIEWDAKIPELQVLLLEAKKAHFCLQEISDYAHV
jgi:uncharacterized protein